MSYSYEDHRPYVMSDEGQTKTFDLIDYARGCIRSSGAVLGERLLNKLGGGDSWEQMAIVDRLVELGYLRRVEPKEYEAWQCYVYVAGRRLQ